MSETDYVAIVLQGLCTGIGVILAHELYDTYKKYRKKIEDELIKNNKKEDEKGNGFLRV